LVVVLSSAGGLSLTGESAASGAATTVSLSLDAPIVGIAATSDGRGYWLVGSDGGIFTFGDAHYYGSMGGRRMNASVVGIAAGSRGGYWMVGSDGGIFTFGNTLFYGSMGGEHLNAPIVGIASTPGGGGYWLVASDGGVFSFGAARYYGSMGDSHLDAAIVGMAPDNSTGGYRMVGSDGGIFAFHSPYAGSDESDPLRAPMRAIAPSPSGDGYWLATETGAISAFGGAPFEGAIDGTLPPVADPPASDVDGARIAAIAESQVGETDPYLYGPIGSGWCGYFASWVYEHAGIPMPPSPLAYEIGAWSLDYGGRLLSPSSTPQVGDAVLFEPPFSSLAWPDEGGLGYPNIEHVNIVVQVLPGGGIITVGGNESGAVREQGPYSAADASSWWGQAIYAFVQPPGV
jgi:hypothetical protein